MTNVQHTIKDGVLTITVDLKKKFGPSASGKTIRIASSEGNVDLGGGVRLGLNVYEPAPAKT